MTVAHWRDKIRRGEQSDFDVNVFGDFMSREMTFGDKGEAAIRRDLLTRLSLIVDLLKVANRN